MQRCLLIKSRQAIVGDCAMKDNTMRNAQGLCLRLQFTKQWTVSYDIEVHFRQPSQGPQDMFVPLHGCERANCKKALGRSGVLGSMEHRCIHAERNRFQLVRQDLRLIDKVSGIFTGYGYTIGLA